MLLHPLGVMAPRAERGRIDVAHAGEPHGTGVVELVSMILVALACSD